MKRRLLVAIVTAGILTCSWASPISAQREVPLPGNRIPVLNTVSNQGVLVSREAADRSPVLEPADIVVQVERGAFFVLLQDPKALDTRAFTEALQAALGADVRTVATEPFLWLVAPDHVSREDVLAALDRIEEELDWSAYRTVGWGSYF